MALRFARDRGKDVLNQEKHGVSFDEADTVFGDEMALFMSDPDHSDDEDRLSAARPQFPSSADRGLPLLSRE